MYYRLKQYLRGAVDEIQVRMPELVAKNKVKNLVAESLKVPEQG